MIRKNSVLRLAIFERGLTQRELAKRTGLHESIISRAVHGKANLDPVTEARIAVELGKRPGELIGEDR